MPSPYSAGALPVGPPLLRIKAEGRLLNTVGVVAMAFAFAVLAHLQMSPGVRAIGGLLVACAAIASGHALHRWKHHFGQWSTVSVRSAGYVLAAFFIGECVAEQRYDYMLVQAGVVLAAALLLRDRLMHYGALAAGAVSLAFFGAHWHQWGYVDTACVVVACYAFSLTYARILTRGGLTNAASSLLPGKYCVSALEARWLERAIAAAAYAALVWGTCVLANAPIDTTALAIEALLLIGFGFATDKRQHRLSGVAAIFLACGKLWIVDLSGAADGVRMAVGFLAFGVCAVTAGITYLVEYRWKSNPKPDDTTGGDNDNK